MNTQEIIELERQAKELWRIICHAAYRKQNSFNNADCKKYSDMRDTAENEYKSVMLALQFTKYKMEQQ